MFTATTQDDTNWKILFEIQFENLQGKIWNPWIKGLIKLGIDMDRVPRIDELNAASRKWTSWEWVQTDKEFNDPKEWYSYTRNKQMTLSNFVRTPEELVYCSEPDQWHDIMGHIPLLMNKDYSDMYVAFSDLYFEALEKKGPVVAKKWDQVAWFTIEVGLIRENETLKAFGATLYSSSGELDQAYKKENQRPVDLEEMIAQPAYDRSHIQDTYFVLDSLDDMYTLMDEFRQTYLS